MLETVKSYIETLDDISFDLFYINYIIEMQDMDLENEFKRLTNSSTLNPGSVTKLIQSTYEGLVSI